VERLDEDFKMVGLSLALRTDKEQFNPYKMTSSPEYINLSP